MLIQPNLVQGIKIELLELTVSLKPGPRKPLDDIIHKYIIKSLALIAGKLAVSLDFIKRKKEIHYS